MEPLHLLAFYAGSPVFDGEEDRNGLRNADEAALWLKYLDGALTDPAPKGSFVIVGDANLDPMDGEGRTAQMRALLDDPRLQDPKPGSEHALSIANAAHSGDAALDTADWDDPTPGNLRVDYVLPSADLTVRNAGVAWSKPEDADPASRHGLVWVDIALFP
jgi:endonuclease/exonuclease/phosphatase family metal-dependent hydrolase